MRHGHRQKVGGFRYTVPLRRPMCIPMVTVERQERFRSIAQRAAHLRSTARVWDRIDLTFDEQTFERSKPRDYLLLELDLLDLLAGPAPRTVVEIGSMRQPLGHPIDAFDPRCCNDGHSTAFFCARGHEVFTVDVDPACAVVLAPLAKANPRLHVSTGDGIAFLRNFQRTIDLLFLDAWDVVPGQPFAERHVEAFEAARDKLAPHAVIAIDDTDIGGGGKGRLLMPHLMALGWKTLVVGRQAIFLRP